MNHNASRYLIRWDLPDIKLWKLVHIKKKKTVLLLTIFHANTFSHKPDKRVPSASQ